MPITSDAPYCKAPNGSMTCAVQSACAQAFETLPADELGVSSLHMTFNQEAEAAEMAQLGYLHRTGIQYHWCPSHPVWACEHAVYVSQHAGAPKYSR